MSDTKYVTLEMSAKGYARLERHAKEAGQSIDDYALNLMLAGLTDVMLSGLRDEIAGIRKRALEVLPTKGEA